MELHPSRDAPGASALCPVLWLWVYKDHKVHVSLILPVLHPLQWGKWEATIERTLGRLGE